MLHLQWKHRIRVKSKGELGFGQGSERDGAEKQRRRETKKKRERNVAVRGKKEI